MFRIGFHVSISGGFSFAVERAFELGCTTMQIFSRNPRGWTVKPLNRDDIAEFKRLRELRDVNPVFVHTNYLINLASKRPDLYEKSIEQFIVDLERTEAIGAEYLVTHLGSASGQSGEWMIDRVSSALNMAMKLHKPKAMILLENTAGEKGDIGYQFDQMGAVIAGLHDDSPVGICYDTCHGFAAGYDIRTQKHVDALAASIDKEVGFDRVKLLHLNDCLRDFGSNVDRHWHIGKGKIGPEGFRALLNHPAFLDVPKVMETPKKEEDDDVMNMKMVKSLIKE